MSLAVPTAVLDAAERGPIDDAVFLDVIRTSLPYAWDVVAAAAADRASERPFGEHEVPPPSEAERGQLLRALASNAIRGSLETHFGVRLAFQNCHRLAAFPLGAESTPSYQTFTSQRAQLLNQSPQLRNC